MVHNGFLKEFCDFSKNPDFPTSVDVMLTTSYSGCYENTLSKKGT